MIPQLAFNSAGFYFHGFECFDIFFIEIRLNLYEMDEIILDKCTVQYVEAQVRVR